MGAADMDGYSAAAAQGADCPGDGAPPRGAGGASLSLWHCPACTHITGLYITSDLGVRDAGFHVSITPMLWGLCGLHCLPSGQVGHDPHATPPSTGGGFQTPACGPSERIQQVSLRDRGPQKADMSVHCHPIPMVRGLQ